MKITSYITKGSQNQRNRVLVLGGSGFIGRHAVQALLERDAKVVIGTRHPQRPAPAQFCGAPACQQRYVRLEQLCEARDWRTVLQDIDVVINCVGILRQRPGETYHDIHCRAPAALAQACKARGLRLIHVSALGLAHPVRSRFLSSKLHGEQAIRHCGGDWHIVRPSLVDGDGGFGAKWIRTVANWPVHVWPRNARGRIAALDGCDLGAALACIAVELRNKPDAPWVERVYEVGGDEERPLGEHLLAMRSKPRLPVQFTLPPWLARMLSHLCDALHVTPYSFGHYELLRNDNVPAPNRLAELLGRPPRKVGCQRHVREACFSKSWSHL